MTEILLGYEADVEDPKPVYLPLHHTGFTGMTQKAGKTTGIEAASMRSERRAITFRTKRGEVGFETTGVEIKPFFVEHSDWQYVESLIEATLRENQRFNRSWIIRACEGTKTLNEVWKNIKAAKKKARGLALSVYTNLDAYFKIVLPEIRRYKFSTELKLAEKRVSVMNLIGMPTEVQALVIRSVIDYIHEHEKGVIVVIPEAWKFIGILHTPVTYAAERLIREGASVENYLFVDSQDISGINSRIRGQIDNWILGRQKYEHEIDRTLKAIPIKNKPRKEQIQTLKLGHFYAACDIWVKKIYFLPWGISEKMGIAVAKGIMSPEEVKEILEERRKKTRKEVNEDLKWKLKYEEALEDIRQLNDTINKQKERITALEKELDQVPAIADAFKKENKRLKEDMAEFRKLGVTLAKLMPKKQLSLETKTRSLHLKAQDMLITVHDEGLKEIKMATTNKEGQIIFCALKDFPQTNFTHSKMKKAMAERGWPIKKSTLSTKLSILTSEALLIRTTNGYRIPSKIKFEKK